VRVQLVYTSDEKCANVKPRRSQRKMTMRITETYPVWFLVLLAAAAHVGCISAERTSTTVIHMCHPSAHHHQLIISSIDRLCRTHRSCPRQCTRSNSYNHVLDCTSDNQFRNHNILLTKVQAGHISAHRRRRSCSLFISFGCIILPLPLEMEAKRCPEHDCRTCGYKYQRVGVSRALWIYRGR